MKTMKGLSTTVIYILAIFWFLVALLPFAFMVFTSFKEQFELLTKPIWALPSQPTLANYTAILSANFFLYLFNSAFVVSVSIILVVLISAMAAYVFARIPFRFSSALFVLIIAGLIVPIHVTLIPVYLLMTRVGLYDKLVVLIGPYVAFSLPISIFILTQFMRQIPRELEDAARIDGCGPMGTFFRVVLPLSRPGLATIAIFNAVSLWNEFVFAFVLTQSPSNHTLPLALWDFQGQYSANIPMIMTTLTLSAIPLIIAYIIGQEQLVKGIMAGAVKG